MNKKEFVTILKEVSDKLEAKNIEHEIPFTYLEKEEFNYINLVIPNSIDARQLSTMLNIYEVKEKDDVISCKYKDIIFNFVKSDPQLAQFAFYYYCWMPLSNLLATTANQMGLTYDVKGLRYVHPDGMSILISKNLEQILDFFGLPFVDYIKGFMTENIIYSYFCMNNFFNPIFYTEENIRKVDKYYDLNKEYYVNFYKYIELYANYQEELEDPFFYYYIVDEFFPDINFMRKVYKLIAKKDLPEIGDINNIRNSTDLETLNIRTVLGRAMDAEKRYKNQLDKKRSKRKDMFKGLLDDIKKEPSMFID